MFAAATWLWMQQTSADKPFRCRVVVGHRPVSSWPSRGNFSQAARSQRLVLVVLQPKIPRMFLCDCRRGSAMRIHRSEGHPELRSSLAEAKSGFQILSPVESRSMGCCLRGRVQQIGAVD